MSRSDGGPDGSSHASEDSATVPEDPRELLVELVSRPTPSGQEGPVARLLVEYFRSHDREAWIDEVGNVRAPGDDAVLLTSHMDTVPGDVPVAIAPAESGNEAEPALWGRGSVDATGSLAAMAVAAVRTGVSFVGVVREETDSLGARHLVSDRREPEAVINGEPSGWSGITLGYRGFLAGTYEVRTEATHTSRPEKNAVQMAMDWGSDLEATVARDLAEEEGETTGEESSVFESVTAKPVAIDGGPENDGLGVGATVEFQVRVPPGHEPSDLVDAVERATEGGSVDWDEDATVPPLVESPRNPAARAFRAAIRAEGGDPTMLHKTGTADANVYADAWDCPVVTYGPGDSSLDHAPNEHLPLAEYDRAVGVLEAVATRLQP